MNLPANPLHPKILTVWRLLTAAALAVWVLGWAGAAVAGVPVVVAGVLAALGLPILLVPGVKYRHWRYEIRERDLFLARGVWFVKIALVPFDRIQFVETRQGPLDRAFELMQLVVHTAGGRESIPGLTIAEAERMREDLSRVTGTLSV